MPEPDRTPGAQEWQIFKGRHFVTGESVQKVYGPEVGRDGGEPEAVVPKSRLAAAEARADKAIEVLEGYIAEHRCTHAEDHALAARLAATGDNDGSADA